MPIYSYKVTDNTGNVVEGSMEAIDEKAVVSKLHNLEYIPIKIEPLEKKKREIKDFFPLFKRISNTDVMLFTQDISTLLGSGLPLDKSLLILTDITENEQLKKIVSDILKNVQEGSYLSDSLAKYPDTFSRLYINMIKAGEAGGVLELILMRLAEFLKNSQELREYIKSAMVYPLLLVLVGGVSMIILLTFVIPKFSVIFSDMGQSIPLSTRFLLGLSNNIRAYWWLILGVLGIVLFFWKKYINTPKGRLNLDRSLLKFALTGKLIKVLEVAKFARTLGTLLKSGVPILDALSLVKEIIGNRVIADSMETVYKKVKEGERLAKPLGESNIFPTLAIQTITVGEETGKLDELLLRVADNYDNTVKNMVKKLINLLEPMMILFMGLIIGFIVISMLMAIFSVNEIPF